MENNDTRRRLTIFLAFQKSERGKKTGEGGREGAVSGQIMTDRLEAKKKNLNSMLLQE